MQSAFNVPSGFCYSLVRALPNVDLLGQVSKLLLSEVLRHDVSSVSVLQPRLRVEMKPTDLGVFKMVATAIKVKEHSCGRGCFFFFPPISAVLPPHMCVLRSTATSRFVL